MGILLLLLFGKRGIMMKGPTMLLLLLLFVALLSNHVTLAAHWALIVAGARGYENYRHQANACHAYQIMLQHGIPKENIVTMMYDDIAYNSRNPFKGNIINEENGPNVYEGVQIDYKGRDVTAPMFLKVLQGQRTGAGNGRVLNTGPDDHIFVYYSDHGGTGFLHFPDDRGLYARQFDEALTSMHKNKRYGKMVIYTEACHSGSMFDRRLRSDMGIYVMTAANPYESSYGCCYDRKRKAFLGDQFSGAWMRDTEHHDISRETLQEQYSDTRRETRHSHVSLYGDTRGMAAMHVGAFQGVANSLMTSSRKRGAPIRDLVESWDVPYQTLMRQLEEENTTVARMEIVQQLQVEQRSRLAVRNNLERIVGRMGTSDVLLVRLNDVSGPSVVVDRCYEEAVDEYLGTCTQYAGNDYRLKDLHVFMNLCRDGRTADEIKYAIHLECDVRG